MDTLDVAGLTKTLNSALSQIYSTKKPERKRGLEILREQLHDVNLCKLLESNTLRYRAKDPELSKLRTWDTIFEAAVAYFLQVPNMKTTCAAAFDFVQSVVTRANSNGPFLSFEPLYDFILSKLNDETVLEIFSFGLMQMLQNLLSVNLYTGLLRGNHWKHIIVTLVNLYKNSTVPKTMILETLNVSIIHGSNIPDVILILRNEVVQFYRSIYLEEHSRVLVPMVLVNKGVVLLCRYNAIEFREILCKLGEVIIPIILSHVGGRDHDEESTIIDVLLVQMQLHAPCDVQTKSHAFYAEDREKWDEILDRIYTFAVDLIDEIAKKSGYTKNVKIPDNLLRLAVKATRLVHDRKNDEAPAGSDGFPPAKRIMTHKSFSAIVSDTVHFQPSETQLVWIQYIAAVLNSFPEISDCNMIYRLHRMGVSLLNSAFIVRGEVYLFFRSLLYVEMYLKQKGVIEKENSWAHVCDIVIKSLEVNQTKTEALEFIRSLLVEVESSNIDSVLFLFVEHGLNPTIDSLNLLSEFLTRCTLPEHVKISTRTRIPEGTDKSCPRLALTNWLIDRLMDKCIIGSEIQVATVLTALIVNRSALFLQTEYLYENSFQIHSPFKLEFEDFEPIILKGCFVTPPNPFTVKIRKTRKVEDRGTFTIIGNVADKLVAKLQEDFERVPPIEFLQINGTPAEFPKKLSQLQYRVSVLLNITNLMDVHKLGEEASEFKSNMKDLFDRAIQRYATITSAFLHRTEATTIQLYSVLKVMRELLLKNDHLCHKLKLYLASKYPAKVLDCWKQAFWRSLPYKFIPPSRNRLLNSPSKEFCPVRQHEENTEVDTAVSEKRAVELASVEALHCLLGVSAISEQRREILTDLVLDCNQIGESFTPIITLYMDMCVNVITEAIPAFSEMKSCHEDIMLLLQALCRNYYIDMNSTVKIFEIFSKLGPSIGEVADSTIQSQFMSLVVVMIRKLDSCGIDVVKIAFKTLSILAKCDPLMQWTLVKKKQSEPKPVFPLVVDLLRSKSQQVRLCGVNFFCDVFEAESLAQDRDEGRTESGRTQIIQATARRKELYELVYTTLLEVYKVPKNFAEESLESASRTSIVISCLVKAMFAFPFNQKRILFSLLLIIKLKSISIDLANMALKNASPSAARTLIAHIVYVLGKWVKLKYSILEFPFQLFDCQTQEEFFSHYRREISFQLFNSESDNSQMLEDFSKLTGKSVLDLIKECYGIIMSRLILGHGEEASDRGPTKQQALSHNLNFAYTRLIHIFGNVVNAEDHLKVCLHDVILNMVSLTYEAEVTETWNCGRIRIPEPEPPFYEESRIRVGLEKLAHKLRLRGKSVIGHLVQTSPQNLYRTLLILVLRIHHAHDWLEKFWRLHHYALFVKFLLAEPRDTFEVMKVYVCQFTVYSYLRLLSDARKLNEPLSAPFISAVLHILLDYVKTLTVVSLHEMSLYFRPLVSAVIATISSIPETSEMGTRLLDFLLKTSGVSFTKCIESLDPFPSEIESLGEYREIHGELKYGSQRNEWTLEKELRVCLEQMSLADQNQEMGSFTKERLRFIKELLSRRKLDLEQLVKRTCRKRFSDDCVKEQDIVHSLIQLLLLVITRSRNQEIILEGCRCLGEIGPIDLAVLVLPSTEANTSYYPQGNNASLTPYQFQTKKIESLNDFIAESLLPALISSVAAYLLSEDIQLVATTGDVLHSLLQTREIAEFLNSNLAVSNPRSAKILMPFTGEASVMKNGIVSSCSPSELETKLNSLEAVEFITYSKWVTELTCGLIAAVRPEDSLFHRLLPLCQLKFGFCEGVLPYLIYACLMTSKQQPIVRQQLSSYFQKFFRSFSTLRSSSTTVRCAGASKIDDGETLHVPIHANKLALRCLLRVVQFLRHYELGFEIGRPHKSPWDANFWLDVNYLDLAKAAQFCGAYLSSILYSEIHAYSRDDKESLIQGFPSYEMSLRSNKSPKGEIEKLLLKAYISIGESDAVYGCGSARYSDFTSNVHHLEQMNEWGRSLAAHDIHYDGVSSQHGIATSLKESGLFNALWTYLKGAEAMTGYLDPDLSEIQYECGWRLSKWDLNCDKAHYVKNVVSGEEFTSAQTVQKCIYESIQSALKDDKLLHTDSIRRGLLSIVQDLKHAALESSENLYPFLTQFQMFRIVEDFYATRSAGVPLETLLQNWKLLDRLRCSNLKFQEPLLYLRTVLLKAFNEQQCSPVLINSYDECILQLVSRARRAGRLELAEACTSKIFSESMLPRKEVEVAKNHWARGEQDVALSILNQFIKAQEHGHNPDIHASSMLLYGEWLNETKSENPTYIRDNCFMHSVKMYESKQAFGTAEEIANAYITLAKYSDSMFQNISSYVKSDVYQAKRRMLEKAKLELEQLRINSSSGDKDAQKTLNLLQRQIALDSQEANTTLLESKKSLTIALRYYLRGLRYSTQHDLLIFRAIGLWLDNAHFPETLKVMSEECLQSYKYVIVLHQLCARLGLSTNNGVGESLLQKILLKCAHDHPYHTLPVLLAQAMMHADKQYQNAKELTKNQAENTRVIAARHLVNTLRKSSLSDLTDKMENLCSALISLANYQEPLATKTKLPPGKEIQIPGSALLTKMRNIGVVPIPTIPVKVSPSGNYKDLITGIHSFKTSYIWVGGINSPKRISCIGSNGQAYNMLLKGNDDLRQDAVMQQVFGAMNRLLEVEPKTNDRHLHIRTYKVVPLSQRSGVIEWCENTHTFGDYLIKAHPKYRPNDYSPAECRKKMQDVVACQNQKKLEIFNDIMGKFKPVFRHFFFENFKDPGTFFERRLAYTRSVATSSIVGYILGLGDRHVANILVDVKTAEFIHIDLGIAFEQGRLLPTPEIIPFRLTRDVVDGMGFCGTEGDFRRCCDMTLEVLRKNTEIILTILEVLLYDPLYSWTLSADRVQKVQPGVKNKLPSANSGIEPTQTEEIKERNNSAARVLLRLKQKLIGVEEGVSSGSTLSISGHVSLLIQRACETSRLSRIFPGWQPYL